MCGCVYILAVLHRLSPNWLLSAAEMKDSRDGKLYVPLNRATLEIVPLVSRMRELDIALTVSEDMLLYIF